MTKKEERKVRMLEIRIEELELRLTKAQSAWVDEFHALYESRVALKQAFELIEEAAEIIYPIIKNDPQFIARKVIFNGNS